MTTLEQQYVAGRQACIPDEMNYKADVGLDVLFEYFMVGKAQRLVLSEYKTLFMVDCVLFGYDTRGNDNEYRISLALAANTKDEALEELRHYELHEYYLSRFKDNGYLAW